ncbi:hypothetical protein LMIY3S_04515 [Labrys miyagiensis]
MNNPHNIPAPGDAQTVAKLRQAMLTNGYQPVRVRTGAKNPVANKWTQGEHAAAHLNVTPEAMNTGMLTAGLRAIDIDVDDEATVESILKLATQLLGSNPPIRFRANSARITLLYRAAEGEPGKRSVSGSNDKVEIMGAGQQIVVDGTHPTGAGLQWLGGRSPATVRRDDLSAITEKQVGDFLAACEPHVGVVPGNVVPFPPQSPVACVSALPRRAPIVGGDDELSAGISDGPFDDLTSAGKSAAVNDWLGKLDNTVTDLPYDKWRNVVWACADAEMQGCADARNLALGWSRKGAGWTKAGERGLSEEAAFNAVWRSFRPGKIAVGTLVEMAKQAASAAGNSGYDPWTVGRTADAATQAGTSPTSAGHAAPNPIIPISQLFGADVGPVPANPVGIFKVDDLPQVSRHRAWIHGMDCARGYVTLLVAPGGRGKSTLLLTMAMAIASGRNLLNSHIFGTGLRALFISAEDGREEVARRVYAAMTRHGLSGAELDGLCLIGAEGCGTALLTSVKGQAILNEPGWQWLEGAIGQAHPDVVFLDPLVTLMGGVSVNDNAAAGLLMGRLAKIAAAKSIAIVIAHHARKGADPASAEAAMGAASLVNLARIALSIEVLGEDEARTIGIMPSDAWAYFRVVSTKANLSPANKEKRWFHLGSVELPNAEPPIYMNGDSVAVIETFTPVVTGGAFTQAILDAAYGVIASANPPFVANPRGANPLAADAIATAIAPLRGGQPSPADGDAVLRELMRIGKVAIGDAKVPRQDGGGTYRRKVLIACAPESAQGVSGGDEVVGNA